MKLFNQHTAEQPTDVFSYKFEVLIDRLEKAHQSGKLTSEEDVLAETSSLMYALAKDITKPITDIISVNRDSLPDVDKHNKDIENILADLVVLFKESHSVESSIITSFNHIITETNKVIKEIREVNSLLADYRLFTQDPSSGAVFYSDSFNNFNKVEPNTQLYDFDKVEINEAEGVISLFVDKAISSLRDVRSISINSSSNGVIGNNSEIGAQLNKDISTVVDSNADTWFEYESTTDVLHPLSSPLILDLTLELYQFDIVNSIIINPYNFGTKSPVKIKTIETSLDGVIWKSIEDDLVSVDVLDKSDIFELSQSSSKYKGKGIYSFFPRKIKFIHIIFEQSNFHIINSVGGLERFRYAIGIRDIDVHGYMYKSGSELITKQIGISDEIKKISIESTQYPEVASELSTITHFVSHNDGANWNEIQPRNIQTTGGLEVLNFNTIDANAIKTETPVNNIRYRIQMKRQADAFQAGKSSILAETKQETAETFTLSDASPVKVVLKESPLSESLIVMDPIYGSVGNNDRKYFVGSSSGEDNQTFNLPWQDIERGTEQIWIGNSLWTRIGSFDGTGQDYVMDYELGTISFGDGTDGSVPASGSKIEINFEKERIWVGAKNLIKLNYHTDGDKDNVIIRRIEDVKTQNEEILVKNATIQRLKYKFVVQGTVKFNENVEAAFPTGSEVTYIDGIEEFVANPDSYSINYNEGIVYSDVATSDVDPAAITYNYIPKVDLNKEDWSFYGSGILKDEIQISEDAHKAFVGNDSLTAGKTVFQLTKDFIKPGSLKFVETGSVFSVELPFIDGIIELTENVKIEEEPVPTSGTTFTLQGINSGTSIVSKPSPVFTDTVVFENEVPSPSGAGDYNVNYSTGLVTTITTLDGGTVSYYYNDDAIDMTGHYSIDYENGILYTNDAIGSSTTAQYEYSDYEAVYGIARILSSDHYTINAFKKEVIINDHEVISGIVRNISVSQKSILKVLYSFVSKEMGSLSELEQYYSPIVRGYVLSIIGKQQLTG